MYKIVYMQLYKENTKSVVVILFFYKDKRCKINFL